MDYIFEKRNGNNKPQTQGDSENRKAPEEKRIENELAIRDNIEVRSEGIEGNAEKKPNHESGLMPESKDNNFENITEYHVAKTENSDLDGDSPNPQDESKNYEEKVGDNSLLNIQPLFIVALQCFLEFALEGGAFLDAASEKSS